MVMAMTETPSRMAGEAVSMAKDLVDAALSANERLAHVVRVWIDESLGVQQDFALTLKRAIEEAQETFVRDDETPNMLTCATRASDYTRLTFSMWSEAGIKASERYSRVVQVAYDEWMGIQNTMMGGAGNGTASIRRRSARGG